MDKKNKRKSISKKIRFEVFKRDSFTCQYCGKSAPDALLHIDHINPIAGGGEDDILNLVTSCQDCNLGKGARKLSDNSVVKKQKQQLKEASEKLEQLKLIIQWKEELVKLDGLKVQPIEKLFSDRTGHGFSDNGKAIIKQAIDRYGYNLVYDATEKSICSYFDSSNPSTIQKTFDYISRIARSLQTVEKDPGMADIYKVKNFIFKKFYGVKGYEVIPTLKKMRDKGVTIDEMLEATATFNSWNRFKDYFSLAIED